MPHEHDRRTCPPAITAVGDVGTRDETHPAWPTDEPDAVPMHRLEPARFSDAPRPARTATRSAGHYSRLDGLPPPAAPRPDSTWNMTLAAVIAQKGVMGNPPARSARAVHTLQLVST
jgi:hypothetical protein